MSFHSPTIPTRQLIDQINGKKGFYVHFTISQPPLFHPKKPHTWQLQDFGKLHTWQLQDFGKPHTWQLQDFGKPAPGNCRTLKNP